MSEQAKLGLIKYKKGTYILIEGDEGKEIFYIVKEGSIQIDRSVEKIVQAKGEILQPGDFFGVISAMSRHPSTETAFTLTDTVLITVGSEQFGYLIKQSTPLAMKIIRYFSKKLRFFDSLLTQLSSKKKEEDSDFSQIYEIADYYFNSGNVPLSLYAYHKYLELVPEGELKVKANEMLQRYGRFKEQAFNPPANIGGFNRKYKKDTFIFCEHEEGKDLFIIQQGKVKITKLLGGREVLLAVLKAGDIFGEMSILENQPRSASAIAFDGDVNLLAVNQQNFSNMVVEQPQLATRLITLLSERIWSIYRQINNLLLGDITARIYDTLVTILLKERVQIKKNEKYIFEFGVKELINMLGMTFAEAKEPVTEVLSDKLFRVEPNKILCGDIEELDKRLKAYIKKLEILRKGKRN